ncbi:MAG: BrnA antitoxin family protein [Pseudomonadota bacterium]
MRRLARQDEEAVDTTDIPEITNWDDAVRGRFYRPVKEQVTLRIDADLLAWFRAGGNKYQTRINAALREYIRKHPAR